VKGQETHDRQPERSRDGLLHRTTRSPGAERHDRNLLILRCGQAGGIPGYSAAPSTTRTSGCSSVRKSKDKQRIVLSVSVRNRTDLVPVRSHILDRVVDSLPVAGPDTGELEVPVQLLDHRG